MQAFAASCFQDSHISYLTNKHNKNLPKTVLEKCFILFSIFYEGWTTSSVVERFYVNPRDLLGTQRAKDQVGLPLNLSQL